MTNSPKLLLFLLLAFLCAAHPKADWKSKTIYQLLTDRFARTDGDETPCPNLHKYCNGTFKGITKNLQYIKDLGFDAIWISPIPENKGDDYHGYALKNLFKVNPHFGTEDDLKEMVIEAHKLGLWVMLDVVVNHVACIGTDYWKIHPFNKSEYYYPYCTIIIEEMWKNISTKPQCFQRKSAKNANFYYDF